MKKTNNFNYFTQSGRDEEHKKNSFKKAWKWIKIVIYGLVFALTMTGCVQSFVLKNSTTVGNSIEFFLNKEDIEPKVNTLTKRSNQSAVSFVDNKGNIIKNKEEDKSDESQKISIELLSVDADKNTYLNDREILKSLREQTASNNGEYAKSKTYATTYALNLSKEEIEKLGYESNNFNIISKGGKYLFRHDSAKKYQYLNDINDIYLLVFRTSKEVEYVTLEKHTEVDENKKEKQVLSVDENNNFTLTGLSGIQTIYKFDENDEKGLNAAYARDILQTFYNFSFGKNSEFVKTLNKVVLNDNKLANGSEYTEFSEYLKTIADKLKNNNNGIKISQVEAQLISVYQESMVNYLGTLGLINKGDLNNFDPEKTTIRSGIAINGDKYDYQANKFVRWGMHKLVSKDGVVEGEKRDISMSLRGDYPLQPITSWKEAWGYGPFYGLLVYPLAALTQSMRQAIPELSGWGSIIVILITLILTRLAVFGITFKSKMMQSVQEGLRTKKAAIEAKYVGFEKNKAMKMKKNQEIQALYAKYNISPLDQFGSMLITMPIFFAMWRVIQGIPEIKQTVWLGLNFSSVSWSKITSGEFIYAWILILTIAVQVLSQLLPKLLDRRKFKRATTVAEAQALKKSEKTQKIMVIVFAVITVMFSVGVQVYWLFGGLWQISEVLFLHRLKKTKWFKEKYSKRMLKK